MNSFNFNNRYECDIDLVYHWRDLKKKPSVIVFDLDHTLWPFYVDTTVKEPFTKVNEAVFDANNKLLAPFESVTKILKTLKECCFDDDEKLAIASRSTRQDLAMNLIELFGWTNLIDSFQIYSMPKSNHMHAIKNELKFNSFRQVLFFDDHQFNINTTKPMGVFAFKLDKSTGLNMKALHRAFDLYDYYMHRTN
jgi:magnesium-dependent phosphatase 1